VGSTQRLSIEERLTASDTSAPCSSGTDLVTVDEVLTIDGAAVTGYVDCLDDSPVSIPLAGLGAAGANVVHLRAEGAKVRARVTSTDGSTQAVPVDPLLFVESDSVAITAIDVTRVAGSGSQPRVKYTLARLA